MSQEAELIREFEDLFSRLAAIYYKDWNGEEYSKWSGQDFKITLFGMYPSCIRSSYAHSENSLELLRFAQGWSPKLLRSTGVATAIRALLETISACATEVVSRMAGHICEADFDLFGSGIPFSGDHHGDALRAVKPPGTSYVDSFDQHMASLDN